MQTEVLKVTGMTCNGCTSKVAHALNSIPGVDNVSVSLSEGEATVRYNEGLITPEQLKSAVKTAGYGAGATAGTTSGQSKGGCCS
jgi:copper chaperone